MATTSRKSGESNPSKLKTSFPKSNVESTPPKMNAATKIFRANSRRFLKMRKKINKLVIEARIIIRMLTTTKNSPIPSNTAAESRIGSASNTNCVKIVEIRITKKIGNIKCNLFILAEKINLGNTVLAIWMSLNQFFGWNHINFSSLSCEQGNQIKKQ
jgi:hypothetical protein